MRTIFGFLLGAVLLNASCGGKPTPAPAPTPAPTPVVSLPPSWVKAAALSTGMPSGIEVYRNTTAYNGKAMNAYCVAFDPKSVELRFKPVLSATNKKVSQFYSEEAGIKYAAINGGYFGTNVSYSLVKYADTVLAPNIKSLTRTYNGNPTIYYPTRGAFGITSTGIPEIGWVYSIGSGIDNVYIYPAPSPNTTAAAPQPIPSASFPSGGVAWNAFSAIGGSPVLIKNGNISITATEELIDVNNTTSRARTAIGYTAAGAVILLAVEGNNASGGEGLNLAELAQLMKDMGCIGALNLDGGGSTNMIVNGQPTVKPSDAAGERAVVSAIIIKKK